MPRKPKQEVEEEIDIKKPKKRMSYAVKWFNDYAVNNKEDLKIICDLTRMSAEEQFGMNVPSENNEVFGVVFYGTFMTILDFLRGKQATKKNFTIEIVKSINIGYVNNDDEDNEKVGNFMPIMEYIGVTRPIVEEDESTKKKPGYIYDALNRWKQQNIKQDIEGYKQIQEEAYKRLEDDYKITLRTSEQVLPLFCIFMDNINNYIKHKFHEAEGTDVSEVSMNVFGLFDVYYSFNAEDNQEIIDYACGIPMKLRLKNDENANVE